MTASQRALLFLFLYRTAGRDGVFCYDVVVWPDRVLRGDRGVSVNGGGGPDTPRAPQERGSGRARAERGVLPLSTKATACSSSPEKIT